VARAAAFANNRYVQVLDPANPEKVVYVKAQDAAAMGAGTPQSIGYKTDMAMAKYMTSGLGGQQKVAFDTAMSHLALFSEASDALNNGDLIAANRIGNALGMQFGDNAVTNFMAVKTAVAGEVANVFKKSGATDTEIAEINGVLNSSESPEQLHGAINYYIRLMNGKLDALKIQYQSGVAGRPDFNPAPAGGHAPPAGGSRTGDYIYITNPGDPSKKVYKSKIGTRIPQGWVQTDAPK
jgi:hypothetical protein